MEFSSSLNRASRRALSKCNSKSYRFSRLNSEYIVELYSIISANRSSKGFSLSLPLDELSRQISVFGEHYLLFGVYNECNSLCASAVCVRTFSNVLYVLYWADLPSECSFSPIPFLANGLYEYCQNNGFRVLDVGRSSLKGIRNSGLCRFKESLGCEPSIQWSLHFEPVLDQGPPHGA